VPCIRVKVYRGFRGNERHYLHTRLNEDLIAHSAVMLFRRFENIMRRNCANNSMTSQVVSILISAYLKRVFVMLMQHVISSRAKVNKKTH
jgi:hypothetical protein